MERVEPLADGRLLYRFRRPWRDGTTDVVLEPLELLERLSALVPAPRAHLVRYSGLLAPASKWRSAIVPGSSSSVVKSPLVQKTLSVVPQDCLSMPDPVTLVDEFFSDRCLPPSAAVRHARNYSWAELLRRVGIGRFAVPSLFGTDEDCGGDPCSRQHHQDPGLARSALPGAAGGTGLPRFPFQVRRFLRACPSLAPSCLSKLGFAPFD